jgi:hypothetical protein
MKEVKEVQIKGDRVTLTVEDRDRWNRLRRRQQLTFRRRQFELALRKAEVTIPWTEASR